ncbi:MAG TPA: DNA replication/repair protein RecF [Abditibacteriaceae bacterium]|jgi:DNA replication and repair protein RecF
MIVRALRLRNFRNYRAQEVALSPGLVALTGDNGQGKTNLLEALCVLATTKSPLVERDRELIFWNEREARLGADIELGLRPDDIRHLEFGWRIEGNSLAKEMRAGGVPQSQLEAWLGQLQVVAFFPHDLVLITGEPGERRRFLNLELGKSRPAHFADAARYRRALQQRNALLKSLAEARWKGRAPVGNAQEGLGTLPEWNKQLIGYGSRVLAQRAQFLEELQPVLAEVHRSLSGRDSEFSVDYMPGIGADAGENNWTAMFSLALEKSHNDDMRRGTSLVGPHRDDLVFRLDRTDLRRFGSQGQQRLGVLALKIALARWVATTTGESPILLLDDALSELDATRRENLLRETQHFTQSVLTTTDAADVEGLASQHLRVENGRVENG